VSPNSIEPTSDLGRSGIDPLEGEAGIPSVVRPPGAAVSRKGVFAIALLALSLIAVTAVSINRAMSAHHSDDASKRVGDKPAAASGGTRRLDMILPAPPPASAPPHIIPAIVPTADERRTQPIPLRDSGPPKVSPEDAPVMLVTSRPASKSDAEPWHPRQEAADARAATSQSLEGTRQNLEIYQRQLQGVLDSLTKSGGSPTPAPSPTNSPAPATNLTVAPAPALFDGELVRSATPRARAGTLGDRSLVLPKGTVFTCALKTQVISAASGLIGCQVQRNVYSDDGRVLLVERGSHVDGEYRIATVRPGTVRIPVLWTRIRTPLGVVVDIESPGVGPLGASGIDGYVDNRWPERIGAAMLLSVIDDAVKLAIEDRGDKGNGNTVVFPATTSDTGKLAEKVLDSTINIPPLIYQNQGGVVGIYVARDVDFSSVYELRATSP